ncbi:MAG: universal stress protein, partial [Gemmatimonadales bacterium]
MFKKLLVTLDGSSFSEWALNYAAGLSRRTGADIELTSVHEPIPSFAYDEWEAAAFEWTEEYLAKAKASLSERLEVDVTAWVGSGQVVESLLDRAGAIGADLIVAATHGRGTFSRAWLGSVADGLLRHATQPLLLIRPEKGEEAPTDPAFKKILVPLDGSDFSESVVSLAAEMARLYDGEIHLLRVVAYPIEIASPYLPHTVQMNQEVVEEAKASAKSYLREIAAGLEREVDTVHTHVVVDSQAGAAICNECKELDADLVVMATHGRG